MSNRSPPDKFSLFVPDEQEPERSMPDHLEIVDYGPGVARSKKKLGGGAYNPYESSGGKPGDTVRTRRPKVDLRKLSEWIKTTQQVEQLKHGEGEKDPSSPDDKA
ncbi:MAG TPA: hypothetical protein VN645_14945 [Steroidobacteraceae bacterium]|nr:hypothetical protein [Steroidobacteraceae bacterium]